MGRNGGVAGGIVSFGSQNTPDGTPVTMLGTSFFQFGNGVNYTVGSADITVDSGVWGSQPTGTRIVSLTGSNNTVYARNVVPASASGTVQQLSWLGNISTQSNLRVIVEADGASPQVAGDPFSYIGLAKLA